MAHRLFTPLSIWYCSRNDHTSALKDSHVFQMKPRLFWDHDKFWFAHKTHKVSIRTTRCEEEPNRRSLEVDGLTKQSSEVMEQRATTGNAIVLHFYTFNWFLSLHCLYCSSLYRSELLCIEIATCKIVCPDIENTSRYLSKSYTCHPKIWQLTQQDAHLSLSMCIL